MSVFTSSNTVRYACDCGLLLPIAALYFCRHCLQMRCDKCLQHEVNSYYCSNCLEHIWDRKSQLNARCPFCLECPICCTTLTTRLTKKPDPNNPDDTAMRKCYYLACGVCRWTSRDAGLADRTSPGEKWPVRENIYVPRVNSLVEYHKDLALKEKEEKKFQDTKRKGNKRGEKSIPQSYPSRVKLEILDSAVRKRLGLTPLRSSHLEETFTPSVATDDVDDLSPTVFEEPLNISEVTTLTQRLKQPELQTERVSELYPRYKPLMVKRIKTCPRCEHLIVKPECHPGSTNFKIRLSAYYIVPRVEVFSYEPLEVGRKSELIITLCNPTQKETVVKFLSLPTPTDAEERKQEIEDKKAENKSRGQQMSLNASLTVPDGEIILPPDSVLEDFLFPSKDDPEQVIWRKFNKAAVKLIIQPTEASTRNKMQTGFSLQYNYTNRLETVDGQPQTVTLTSEVFLEFGNF